MNGICRVCELLDNDKGNKYVTYCELCSAWMCLQCEHNLLRRAKAALIEMKNKIKNGSTKG